MAQLSLTVLRCPDYGQAEQRLVRGVELTIGRGTECDWALPDPLRSLSRKHCRLEQVGAAWQVVDLSANGTFINFAIQAIGRDQAQPLRDGDRLRLGDYELEVHLAQADALAVDSPFGAASPLAPGGAGSVGASEPGLFGAAAGAGGSAAQGGFGSARLPGLDDPVEATGPSDSLDLDVSGGLGSFTPAPRPADGTTDDHAPATGDAYRPPAVLPMAAPGGSGGSGGSGFAAAAPGGQAIVPDDWLQSLALGVPPPAGVPADESFGVSAAVPPDALPKASPNIPSDFDPAAAFDDVLREGAPAPAPDASLPSEARPSGFGADREPSTRPGAYTGDWQAPVDVPLSGPGPGPVPVSAAPLSSVAPAPQPAATPPPAFSRAAAATAPPALSASGADPMLAALAALLAGGGLPSDAAPRAAQDPEAALRHAGALMQVAVAGLRALLVARGLVKREFRIEQTMLRPKENNPLKFAASDEHALASLLDPRMGGVKAVQDAVEDLSSHEVAVLAATQSAAHALLEKLSPAALEAEDPGGSGLFGASAEKRLWLAYKRRHETLMAQLEDDFDSAFGIAFARAYERAVDKRKD